MSRSTDVNMTRHVELCVLGLAMVVQIMAGCHASRGKRSDANPPAPGFNQIDSDPRAIVVADATMHAMGGRMAWDETRYLTWRFFGGRLHVWDKQAGDIRVEQGDPATANHSVVLMNVQTRKGRAWQNNAEVREEAHLAKLLKGAYEAWINDAYWLVMPYKLTDSGVTLKYVREAATQDGRMADVLTLTFDGVGVTPENKYDVYVVRESNLVEQWAFYARASDNKPRFIGPWHNWKRHGRIMLSDDHGGNRVHTDVAVFDELPRTIFTNPEPVDLMSLVH